MHSVRSIYTTPAPNEEVLIKTADKEHGLSLGAAPSTLTSWQQKPPSIGREIPSQLRCPGQRNALYLQYTLTDCPTRKAFGRCLHYTPRPFAVT
jgi:hypothetical protein